MATATTPRSTARRWGPGTSAVVRALIATERPVTQVDLATLVGVSQPRVSQVLNALAEARGVKARKDGYVGRPARLLDLYVARHRPKLSQPEQPWYSVQPLREQCDAIASIAASANVRIAYSADVAPDLLVPWRHPTMAVVYADRPLDLASSGFVRAEGRVGASVLMRATADTTLLSPFEPWPREVQGLALVDPVQQIWDLVDLDGEDRREGANRLRRAVIDRTLGTTG